MMVILSHCHICASYAYVNATTSADADARHHDGDHEIDSRCVASTYDDNDNGGHDYGYSQDGDCGGENDSQVDDDGAEAQDAAGTHVF